MGRPRTTVALAAEAWRLMFDFFMRTRPQRDRVLERLSLTPNDTRALGSLDTERGSTMRSLADAWGCDASNATWIVDRLEEKGLAERRLKPGDRRVKLVVLTAKGAKMKLDLMRGMHEPPPQLLTMSRAALEALVHAMKRLPDDEMEKER